MRPRSGLLALITLAALACDGGAGSNGLGPGINTSGGGSGTPVNHGVTVGNSTFTPDSLNIPRGDQVTWTWTGTGSHSVTFRDGLRDSGVKTSGTYVQTFNTVGTFTYFSSPDAGMEGKIVVR